MSQSNGNGSAVTQVWIPTRIKLRCNVHVAEQVFWKGDEADVVQVLPEGKVSVVMKGRAFVLSRSQFEVTGRTRATLGKPVPNQKELPQRYALGNRRLGVAVTQATRKEGY